MEATPFGLDAASASITPTSLHDDFVNMMKTQGLEKMATEAGLLRNGSLVESQQLATPASAASTPVKSGAGKKPASIPTPLPSPSFTSPYVDALPVIFFLLIELSTDRLYAFDVGMYCAYSSPGKKRKYLKINKGLRHFSMKVCQKVEENTSRPTMKWLMNLCASSSRCDQMMR